MEVTGVTLRIVATSDTSGGAYSVVEQLDRPGGGSPPHTNSREDIVIAAVEGTVEVRLPDRVVELSPGQSISVPRNTRHWTRNISSTPSRTLYTFVPGGFEDFFIEAAALGATPHLDQIAKIAAGHGMELAPTEEG